MTREHPIRPLALIATVAVAAGLLTACGGSPKSTSKTTTSASRSSVASTALQAPGELSPPSPAPDFALRDSSGKLVRLSQYKGKAVLLTFIYTHCPDVCPLIVANMHNALLKLGPEASKVQIVAISVDPKGDTPKAVKAFLTAHDMTGRMAYLNGTPKELVPVWKAYGIEVQATPEKREVGHSGLVYGITANGIRRALYPADLKSEWLVHDVPVLASQ